MKKFFVLLFLFLLFLFISADEIKNSNQPLKGQWDFCLKKVWETSTAGDQMLISVSTLRLDEQGNLFAFDTKHSRFFVYSPQGKFLLPDPAPPRIISETGEIFSHLLK